MTRPVRLIFTTLFFCMMSATDLLAARPASDTAFFETALPADVHAERYAARYTLSQLAPNLHTYLVTLTVANTEGKAAVDFILPAWRPGRYQIQNYAASVQEFEAFGVSGSGGEKNKFEKLSVEKTDKQTWRVQTNGRGQVSVRYKFYAANPIDAGNSYCGADEMYFNGSNLFVYTAETRNSPVLLSLDYPDGWRIATQLEAVKSSPVEFVSASGVRRQKPHLFSAETYDDLIDAPTLISPALVSFSTQVRGSEVQFAFHNGDALGGTRFNEQNIKADFGKFIEAQFKLMNDVPFKKYVFIFHIVPRRYHHGVEHKNSCSIVLGPAVSINENYGEFISISSHEFYHVWNIKRIKPDVFMPYDYTRETYTPLLYVAEGFTSYYGELTLIRSKVWDANSYINGVAREITAMQNQYGRKVQSLALSSHDAWLSGYGAGRATSTVSFYSKGELIGMLLDLEIRHRSKNKYALDDVMRALNTEFAQKGKGFSAADFKALVERFSGASLTEFFDSYVYGTEELPFAQTLSYAGLELTEEPPTTPVIGVTVEMENNFLVVRSVEPGSSGQEAGLDNGDMLLAFGGSSLLGQSLPAALVGHKPGGNLTVTFFRDGKLKEVTMKLGGRTSFSLSKKASATPEEIAVCESWLGVKWSDLFI